jgi:hypothetical protein
MDEWNSQTKHICRNSWQDTGAVSPVRPFSPKLILLQRLLWMVLLLLLLMLLLLL